MRNIIHGPGSHNALRGVVLLLVIMAVAVTGCEKGDQADYSATCPVTTDVTVWRSFVDIATRLDGGQEVPRGDRVAFAEMPMMDLWRRSLAPSPPSVINISNWLDAAFSGDDSDPSRGKTGANRRLLVDSYRYSFGHRAMVDSLISDFVSRGACRLEEKVSYWIEESNKPASELVVVFLPALSEIRIENDTLLVDTGAFVAGGVNQTADHIASLLYRNHQALPGENPATLDGGASVAHAFRATVNEGMAGWVARNLEIEFRDDHPRLGSIRIVPETFFQTARRVMDYGERLFPDMVADDRVMQARGRSFTNFMTGQNAYGSLGFAMATVIEAHWDEDHLRKVSRSVPDFLAAYQEAALENPVPAPEPGAIGVTLPETMPPFDPVVFDGLMDLLRTTFPE